MYRPFTCRNSRRFLLLSGFEAYQDLIHPVSPSLPFGFVFAPRMERGVDSTALYIVPPEVLERRDVQAWRFDLKRWGTGRAAMGNTGSTSQKPSLGRDLLSRAQGLLRVRQAILSASSGFRRGARHRLAQARRHR
jgi:hypothetical protein